MLAWVRPVLLAAVMLTACGSAQADWQLSRGQRATILSEDVGFYTRLMFVCADGNLGFGVGGEALGPLPEEEDDEAYLSIQIDGGLRYEAPAAYRRNESGGFDVTFSTVDELPVIISEIIAAKSTIQVDLLHSLFGERFSWTADAKGSTKAGKEFAKSCGIVQQAPIAVDVPNWQTRVLQDPDTGGKQAVLIGSLDRGGQLYASCDGKGSALLGLLAPDLPFEIGDVGLSMIVEIDGQYRTAVGEYFEGGDGQKGVKFAGQYVADVVRDITAARATLKVTVKDYSDESIREWPAIGLSGLSDAGATFDATCGGGTQVTVEMPAIEAAPPADPVTSLSAEIASAVERSNQGDYVGALAILRPLAMRGHPDQPLEWDADARIGFVIVADKLSDQLWSNSASDEEVIKHDADFVLAFQIASMHSESDVIENWGMRYYLGKMYINGRGVAEDGDTGSAWLARVAESGDPQYSPRAKDVLCADMLEFDYC